MLRLWGNMKGTNRCIAGNLQWRMSYFRSNLPPRGATAPLVELCWTRLQWQQWWNELMSSTKGPAFHRCLPKLVMSPQPVLILGIITPIRSYGRGADDITRCSSTRKAPRMVSNNHMIQFDQLKWRLYTCPIYVPPNMSSVSATLIVALLREGHTMSKEGCTM